MLIDALCTHTHTRIRTHILKIIYVAIFPLCRSAKEGCFRIKKKKEERKERIECKWFNRSVRIFLYYLHFSHERKILSVIMFFYPGSSTL